MTPTLRQCPHCGAYVMSDDDLCPRCDHALAISPAETATPSDNPSTATLVDPAHRAALAEPAADHEPAPAPRNTNVNENENSADIGADYSTDDSTEFLPRVVPIPIRSGQPLDSAAPEPSDAPNAPDTTTARVNGAGDGTTSGISVQPAQPTTPDITDAEDPLPAPDPPITLPAIQVTPPPEAPVDEATQPRQQNAPHFPASHTDNPVVKHSPAPASDMSSTEATEPRIAPPSILVAPPPAITPPDPIPAYAAPPQYSGAHYEMPNYGTSNYAPNYDPFLAQQTAYLQQRIQTYLADGYLIVTQGPGEATLVRGKKLGLLGWLVALPTLIGVVWYILILASSGFRRDEAYLTLENDGSLYEDGPGAAHIRQERSRSGRRWGLIGLGIALVCLVAVLILGALGGIVLTQDRYRAALREAYPEFTLFEDSFNTTPADPDDVQLIKDGAVAFSIIAGIVLVGLWGGLTLVVIGVVHARAYHVRVPALPGYA